MLPAVRAASRHLRLVRPITGFLSVAPRRARPQQHRDRAAHSVVQHAAQTVAATAVACRSKCGKVPHGTGGSDPSACMHASVVMTNAVPVRGRPRLCRRSWTSPSCAM